MLRIERVEQYVREQSTQAPSTGITAAEVAQALGIWRSDASSFLNQLEKKGVLSRSQSRPVRFFLSSAPVESGRVPLTDSGRSIFPNIIGSNGSLRLQSQLALSAALYPPSGLHTLIVGETGVGKSLMAEEIWRCILRHRKLQEADCPFVVFNCAEYAENPQLLLSQLFGYEKGAFTGADRTRDGLIEHARGGVLFLDEMHRLPATGQEMFFTVIDKGIYRRLGSSQEHPIQLMIIGATTEDPEGSFLTTFRRRFPMLIQIPNLRERPFRERIQLVELFLLQESRRLGLPIRVNRDALKRMAAYQGEGNIGELKNMLQICCAKAYSLNLEECCYSAALSHPIEIGVASLPRQMISNFHGGEDIEQYFSSVLHEEALTIYPDQPQITGLEPDSGLCSDPSQDAQNDGHSELRAENGNAFWGTVSTSVWSLAQNILHQAHTELGRNYPRDTCLSVALFLQQTQLYAKAGSVFHAELPIPAQLTQAEQHFIHALGAQILDSLGIQMMERELQALALLLRRSSQKDTPRIRLVIVSHGDTIASGIAKFINQILNTNLVTGIDMPIEESNRQMVERLCKDLRSTPAAEGTILLAETMALSAYQAEILQATGCDIRIIPFVNSILALDLCKGILTTTQSMDCIIENTVKDFQHYAAQMLQSRTDGSGHRAPNKKSAVITLCMTGTGSAQMARDYLLSIPSIAENTEVYSLSMTDSLPNAISQLGGRLRLIIGFVDPQISGIPFLGIENLFTQSGLNRISILLHQWPSEDGDEIPFDFKALPLEGQLELVDKKIERFAPSFEAHVISAEVRHIIQTICKDFTDISADRIVRLYIHTASMFERLLAAKQAGAPLDGLPEHADSVLAAHGACFHRLKILLEDSCSRLDLPLSDAEVYYLMLSLPQFDHDI